MESCSSHIDNTDCRIDWQRFTEIIKASNKILLTAHRRPDGDCIGSELAMYHILTGLGKNVHILNHHPLPPTLKFLDPQNLVTGLEEKPKESHDWLPDIDLIIVLDTGVWQQLGNMEQIIRESNAKKIVLDHHESWNDLNAERFVDPSAEATGIIVVRAANALQTELNYEAALALFTSIVSDTGWFAYANVNSNTYKIAAQLVNAGVVPAKVYREIYEQESIGRIRLVGKTLANVESHLDGKLMFANITLDDFNTTGALDSETDGISSMLLKIKNSQVSLLITELNNNKFKLSFRSRNELDCNKIAALFNGGGHKKAAGATSNLPFKELKKQAINAIENALYRSR
ncbi:MAG: bifunctional oligoribonuclease/PAP phosphatase NrnA [Planctomycetaceae bacterium]|jgi:phosphoesterase RecJ-like protein|nr:bifunctional oligoribonuclease/PAP phosphatase NrnA [Planctomycetaceae bacterium]